MQKLLILLFSISFSIQSFGQGIQENQIILDKDSVYSSLLIKHIQYLESISSIYYFLDDSDIFIIERYPITRLIPDSIGDRKVFLINDPKLNSIDSTKNDHLIEILPMYFLNNTIIVVFRNLYLMPNNNSYTIVIQGGSEFIFEFDCIRNEFILREIKH